MSRTPRACRRVPGARAAGRHILWSIEDLLQSDRLRSWTMRCVRDGSGRGKLAATLAVLLVAVQALSAPSPLAARQVNPSTDVRLDLDPALEPTRERASLALDESLRRYAEWLGPIRLDRLRVAAAPAAFDDASDEMAVHVDLPWSGAT